MGKYVKTGSEYKIDFESGNLDDYFSIHPAQYSIGNVSFNGNHSLKFYTPRTAGLSYAYSIPFNPISPTIISMYARYDGSATQNDDFQFLVYNDTGAGTLLWNFRRENSQTYGREVIFRGNVNHTGFIMTVGKWYKFSVTIDYDAMTCVGTIYNETDSVLEYTSPARTWPLPYITYYQIRAEMNALINGPYYIDDIYFNDAPVAWQRVNNDYVKVSSSTKRITADYVKMSTSMKRIK